MYLPIIKSRKIWFTLSSILIIGSLLSLGLFKLNLGIDFTGGTLLEIKSNEIESTQDLESLLTGIEGIDTVKIQPTNENGFILRFAYIDNLTHLKIEETLKAKYTDYEELRYETIGPVMGSDLKRKAFLSLSLAILFIIIYVAFAFRKIPQSMSSWKFGVTAVIALIHDILITVGVFSLLGYFLNIEVDSLFVTALLTVMGFSVHDTIVVFDRIREHLIRDRHRTFAEAAELSVNETLTRSVNTSLTTLFALMALFFFAGESIKYFVLALIIGIFIGTYSSIFLASPFLVFWQGGEEGDLGNIDGGKTLNEAEIKTRKRKKASRKKRR